MYLRHDLRAFNLVTLTRGSRGYRKKPRRKQTKELRYIYMYRIYKCMIYAIATNIYIGNGLYSERERTCLFMLTTTLYNGKNGSGAPYGNIYIYIYIAEEISYTYMYIITYG